MTKMSFGGTVEEIITQKEFSLKHAQSILKKETIAVIGYGSQGQAQALNMRDNGHNIIVGQRKSETYRKALDDGWIEGKDLFSIEEAASKGTIICYLLSDAGQIAQWNVIKKFFSKEKTLYFSHGFAIVFRKQTNIVPPKNIDVILVAPKGSGKTVREHFLRGRGRNASIAVYQDATGHAKETAEAMGIAIGSGFLFPTTFEKETYANLVAERGVLVGAIAGLMEAQYNLLRNHGHSPSEAFNESVESATQSLYPLIGENGMDWMIANCSTTAQRGALDWRHKFRKAVEPVFDELYKGVKTGKEAKIVIEANSKPDYREKLGEELEEIRDSEMWQAGKKVRELRPENQRK